MRICSNGLGASAVAPTRSEGSRSPSRNSGRSIESALDPFGAPSRRRKTRQRHNQGRSRHRCLALQGAQCRNRTRQLHRGQACRETARCQARQRHHQARENHQGAPRPAGGLIKHGRQRQNLVVLEHKLDLLRQGARQRQWRQVVDRKKPCVGNVVAQLIGIADDFAKKHQLVAMERATVFIVVQIT